VGKVSDAQIDQPYLVTCKLCGAEIDLEDVGKDGECPICGK